MKLETKGQQLVCILKLSFSKGKMEKVYQRESYDINLLEVGLINKIKGI